MPAERLADAVLTGIGPGSAAWHLLAAESPGEVGAEGYVLRIGTSPDPSFPAPGSPGTPALPACVVMAAPDEAGLFRGQAALRQLADTGTAVPALTIRDWPQLARRGVVEGFYGPPWSQDERLDFLAFAARVGLNEYIYAPKDDPYHRQLWREPYPEAQLADIAELAGEAAARHVRFVYTLAPALSMRFSDDGEHELLAAKAGQLWEAGIRSFALLFDDVPGELTQPEDIAVFGPDARAAGLAHGLACARFREAFLAPHGVREPLLMCPTDYAGCAPSPYREGLSQGLPDDAIVMWTGTDIVVGEVSRADIDAAAASYRRRLLLWDNFPVNDFDRSRLFLGPLRGRTTQLAGSALAGISSNPMVEAVPSRFALASAADWAWNPGGYDPDGSAERALVTVAGRHARAITALVGACSAWPPSAPQSTRFEALAASALDGDAAALNGLEAALRALAAVGRDGLDASDAGSDGHALHRALGPWLAAARDAGGAGILACALLRRLRQEPAGSFGAECAALRAAQAAADSHYANVLRSVLPRFVLAVLARAAHEAAVPPADRHVSILTGRNPAPGDRDLAERLTARGFGVRLTHEWDGDGTDGAGTDGAGTAGVDLVIVTPGAPAAAARALAEAPVPVLAWGRLETLGLASTSGVRLSQDTADITAAGHPLAAGLAGSARLYRGPGKFTWCAPSADGTVIARTADGALPVIVHYPSGAMLPMGTRAAADRLAFFLAGDGLAPWLITPDGYALFAAAVDLLTAPGSTAGVPDAPGVLALAE